MADRHLAASAPAAGAEKQQLAAAGDTQQPSVDVDKQQPAVDDVEAEKRPSVGVASIAKSASGPPADDKITDLFVCFPPLKGVEPETSPLTVRAVLTGIVLGSLVNASNVYLGAPAPPPSRLARPASRAAC